MNDYITLSEASRMLCCSATWIRKLVDAGKLRSQRTIYGRAVLREDVERLAAEKQQKQQVAA